MMIESLVLVIFSVLFTLGCLGVTGWLVFSHQFTTLDGLFLALVCLVLALISVLNLGWSLRSKEIQAWRHAKKENTGTH
ncbi:MAG: hypothetical protein U0V70_14865 [Terriglobia bacterium]